MKEAKIAAVIKSKFDLGYILELEGGTEAQLRVLEQRGRELDLHVKGEEEKIYGETISVYMVYRDERICSVSQFSSEERELREAEKEKRAKARERCQVGDEALMEVEKDYEWGYLLKQVSGYLSGAIKKPCDHLIIGQQINAVVTSKSNNGAPYMQIRCGENA